MKTKLLFTRLCMLCCLLMLNIFSVNAQKLEIIEVDTLTGQPKSKLPFDRPFILKVKVDEEPLSVEYIYTQKGRSWFATIQNKMINEDDFDEFIKIPKENIKTKKEGKIKYAYFTFGYHPKALYPLKQYQAKEIRVLKRKNEEFIKELKKEKGVLIKKLANSDAKEKVEINKRLEEIEKELLSIINYEEENAKEAKNNKKTLNNNILGPSKSIAVLVSQSSIGFDMYQMVHQNKFTSLHKKLIALNNEHQDKYGLAWHIPNDTNNMKPFYRDSLKTHFDEIDRINNNINSMSTNLLTNLNGTQVLSELIKYENGLCACTENEKPCVDFCELRTISRTLFEISDEDAKAILAGKKKVKSITDKTESDLSKRLSAIKSNSEAILKLKGSIGIMVMKGKLINNPSDQQCFTNALAILKSNEDSLKKAIKIKKEIINKINIKGDFTSVNSVGGSTIINDFESRSKLQIIPDFGYVYYGMGQKGFEGLTPYLGFHINLRSIDKNIPFSHYPNKTIWHRLSFMTAWTLTDIAAEGKREDFFEKSSLLMGGGFRLTNAIKLVGGGMIFYQNDPNPIITNRSLSVTPYVGISIDLDVKQFLNDFTSLKPSK